VLTLLLHHDSNLADTKISILANVASKGSKAMAARLRIFQGVGCKIVSTKGNAARYRGWWITGDDRHIAPHGTNTGLVTNASPQTASKLENYRAHGRKHFGWWWRAPGMRDSAIEKVYMRGSKAGFLGIWDEEDLLMYAGDFLSLGQLQQSIHNISHHHIGWIGPMHHGGRSRAQLRPRRVT